MNKNLVLLLTSGLFFALVWLNWQPSRAKPAAAMAEKPVPIKAALPAVTVDTVPTEEKPQPKHYRPRQVSEAVRRKVDDFIRRYEGVPPEEVYKSKEMLSTKKCFERAFNDPEFQSEVTKRIDTIGAAKGQQIDMINLASDKLDDPENRALLEAMFADDSDLLQEYLLNKLDGAIFDFAFDPSQEQSSNGVTVKSGSTPAPAPAANKLPD